MPCYKPLQAYRSDQKTASGKSVISFNRKHFRGLRSIDILNLPCGQCVGCRIDRSRQWAIRCIHEAQMHENNCFITLTYSDENLPKNNSLDYEHFQLFMKRLRKKFGNGIKFYMCGEYGDRYGRPHFHACIFGIDFKDKWLWIVRDGVKLYRSPDLESLWTYGYSSVGEVTFQSAAYVARYIMKKIGGTMASYHYQYDVDTETGEVLLIKPEFTKMSLREAIGKNWFLKFQGDIFPKDFYSFNGKEYKTPRYYDGLYEISHPEKMEAVKRNRRKMGRLYASDNTFERLRDKEVCAERKLNRLVRGLDKEL